MTDFKLFENDSEVILTTGGFETSLMFKKGFNLRCEAAFEALLSPDWAQVVTSMGEEFADVSIRHNRPLMIDTATWRASSVWFDKLQTSEEDRKRLPQMAVEQASEIVQYINKKSGGNVRGIIAGVVGPRSDAYTGDESITVESAREYHRPHIKALAEAGADIFTAMTLTTSAEACGIAIEVNNVGKPCVISYTLDGRGLLPGGESLKEAIERVDQMVQPPPLMHMVNCVHPRNLAPVVIDALEKGEAWVGRLQGLRGNASAKDHDDLDGSGVLDSGDPNEWAVEMVQLREKLPNLRLLGGCCGTEGAHLRKMAQVLDTLK